MAKKTAAGGKVKKTVGKGSKPAGAGAPAGGGWNSNDKRSGNYASGKVSDSKLTSQRIAKKRG